MAYLSLVNISKSYSRGMWAVENFNLDIAKQDFIVLVGPSGCGKSSILRMIAGLENITKGDLLLEGRRINELSPKERNLAMVFQNYALYPHMTVYDNIAFTLKMRRLAKGEIKKRVEEIAHMLELTPLLKSKPRELSGGQRQRVAFARAMVRDANIFLLDEPLSNLDAALREQIRGELISLHQQLGATFIYVTHDQTEAMTLGTRIVVLKDGLVQQIDTPGNIYNKPRNIFVAGFIGTYKMNFLPGEVKKDLAGAALAFGEYSLPLPQEKSDSLLAAGYEGRDIILGIRPEHIMLGTGITAQRESIELRGGDSLVYLSCGKHRLAVRVDAIAGEGLEANCHISLPPDKLHLFDKETGLSI